MAFNNVFFDKIDSARDIAFPEIKVKQNVHKFSHSPWMSSGRIISQKHKEKLFAKKIKKILQS